MLPLVSHSFAAPETNEDWSRRAQLFEFILAAGGVYVRGHRDLMAATFCIGYCEVKGLPEVEEELRFDFERVPREHLEWMLMHARREALVDREILFHLCMEKDTWAVTIPPQKQSVASCEPLDDGPDSSHTRALIDVHSHHRMRARFSSVDDAAEQGFRIYAVMGNVLKEPEIRVRVGLYGYFWEIPASWVFEMPDGLVDCVEGLKPPRSKGQGFL
ncbi:MAG TPA: Mov34/MPN/PAD-1 family protein [Pyrinomonadaceae bacterium]|jgi:hypothetical protein